MIIREIGGVTLPREALVHQGQAPTPGQAPGTPSAAATTPGLSPAVLRVPGGPTVPDADPVALTHLLGQMANEMFSAPPLPPSPEPLRADTSRVSAAAPVVSPPAPVMPGAAPVLSPATSVPGLSPESGGTAIAEGNRSPFDVPPSFDALFTPTASFAVPELAFFTVPLVDEPALASPPPEPPLAPPMPAPAYEISPVTDLAFAKTPGTALDPHALKREFPILRETVRGRPLVWLDNAATTQKPQAVIDRLTYFYEHENSNIHRAAHTLAGRATDAYEGARESVRRFLHAPSVRDIVFVRGTTEAINLVAQSWGRRHVGEGDEIVISWLEHHANIVPWQQLAAATGARLRVAPVDDRGVVELDEYEKLLGPKTRIVSFTQVSNAIGTVTPAKEMVEMAHRHGARVLVDGAQAVSHKPVDVQALGADFYVFSGHKVFAPTGIGALYAPSELLDSMPPWQGGGNMIQDVTFGRTTYQPAPSRFEAGTGNIADAVGLGAALDWLSRVGIDRVEQYEHGLFEYALAGLATVPGLTMVGSAPERAGVLSFVLAGQKTESVGGLLDEEGIAVRSGHHCAQPILRRFGLEASVRASLAPYNTCEDIDALVAALRRIQAGRSTAR
jgi:cysteine desulfurase/selenocysteine lyase